MHACLIKLLSEQNSARVTLVVLFDRVVGQVAEVDNVAIPLGTFHRLRNTFLRRQDPRQFEVFVVVRCQLHPFADICFLVVVLFCFFLRSRSQGNYAGAFNKKVPSASPKPAPSSSHVTYAALHPASRARKQGHEDVIRTRVGCIQQ